MQPPYDGGSELPGFNGAPTRSVAHSEPFDPIDEEPTPGMEGLSTGTVTHTDVHLQNPSSGYGMASRARAWFLQMAEQHPLTLALGGVGLGVFASLLILWPRGSARR